MTEQTQAVEEGQLRVVETSLQGQDGTVVIEGPTQESVMSAVAKRLAIREAQKVLGNCGVSGHETCYPVDENGEVSEALVLGQRGPAKAYRCDYKLTRSL